MNYEEETKSDSNNNIKDSRVDEYMNKTYTRPTSMFITSSMDSKKIETNSFGKRIIYAEDTRASSSMSRSRTSSESSEIKDYLNTDPISRASALIASQGDY